MVSVCKMDSSDSVYIQIADLFLICWWNFAIYKSSEFFDQTGDYQFFKEDDVFTLVQ
jgi:hypothetical protein